MSRKPEPRTLRRGSYPSQTMLDAVVTGRKDGATLREVAAAIGVHVSTVCRWQKRHPSFGVAMLTAANEARADRRPAKDARPPVYWRKDCPLCKARVIIRKVGPVPFWRCGRWPYCTWASWRPRAPRDCPRCDSPRYWSHSRRSVTCSCCGLRTKRPLTT